MSLKKNEGKRWSKPKRLYRSAEAPWWFYLAFKVEKKIIQNKRVFTITPRNHVKGKHIIFLHGGAYAGESTIIHWVFIHKMLTQSRCRISVLEYPLAPENTYKETFRMVKESYRILTASNNDEIILMGDSAGGGLSLALTQLINKENILRKPSKQVLISPWVDVTMSEPIPKELEDKDILLGVEPLIIAGKNYAGDTDPKHHLISPIYGDFEGMGEVGIWIGTHEIFLVDMPNLKNKLEHANVKYSYYEKEAMQHDYAIFPIKEGNEAILEICEFIN